MHELSVTENILSIALRHANQAGAARINALYLVVGQFASLVDDSVQFYWDLIAKDTCAEGARLIFRRIPAELACTSCDHHYPPGGDNFTCPACGSARFKIVAGEEFYLEAIDVET